MPDCRSETLRLFLILKLEGGLWVRIGGWGTTRFGIEIDSTIDRKASIITGNCVKVFEAITELYPTLRWACINCNPPFSKRWKLADGSTIDSTELTWKFATTHGNYGYFIASQGTLEKLGIDKHPWVYHYETHANVWRDVSVTVGIVFWKRPQAEWTATPVGQLSATWTRLETIIDQEKVTRPKFNIYLDRAGYLRTYLSFRSETKLKLTKDQITRLHRINEAHPLTLTTEKESRQLMNELITCGLYVIEPAAKEAIERALADVNAMACPITPITAFQAVAYTDEEATSAGSSGRRSARLRTGTCSAAGSSVRWSCCARPTAR